MALSRPKVVNSQKTDVNDEVDAEVSDPDRVRAPSVYMAVSFACGQLGIAVLDSNQVIYLNNPTQNMKVHLHDLIIRMGFGEHDKFLNPAQSLYTRCICCCGFATVCAFIPQKEGVKDSNDG